jgi:hypothetical protein
MAKKVIIELSLVDESSERPNNEIANEIFGAIQNGNPLLIPWCKEINKVTVTDG